MKNVQLHFFINEKYLWESNCSPSSLSALKQILPKFLNNHLFNNTKWIFDIHIKLKILSINIKSKRSRFGISSISNHSTWRRKITFQDNWKSTQGVPECNLYIILKLSTERTRNWSNSYFKLTSTAARFTGDFPVSDKTEILAFRRFHWK